MEITLQPTLKQHEAYQALDNPNVDTLFLGGGAGGGKSWFLCESRLVRSIRYPGYKSFIGREELTRLMQSTFLTWSKVCQFHKVPMNLWKFNGQYHYIEFLNGSRIDLLDLKANPSDPLFERFGSLEYTDGAIEEAGEVAFLAFDVLKSRIGRHLNKELGLHPSVVISGNPKKNWTHSEFYKPWKEGKLPSNIVFIQALYKDNKYTAESYEKQLDGIKDKQTKERLKYGNWDYDDDPTCLMNFEAISDLFTNTAKVSFQKYISCDVARFGNDLSVIYVWKGLKLYRVIVLKKKSIDQLKDKLKEVAINELVPRSHIVVDEDGIGGGVVDGLPGCRGFIANAVPLVNKFSGEHENFKSLKAQCTYKLADYVNNYLLEIKPIVEVESAQDDFTMTEQKFIEALTEELSQIKSKDADKDQKRKVLSKEEVKEKLGRSPDFSDTLMMRMYFELMPNEDDLLPDLDFEMYGGIMSTNPTQRYGDVRR